MTLAQVLEHMNNDHGDVLPLYVKHFNKRDDVTEAKLTNITEDGMELVVNGNEQVFVAFDKKTSFEGYHMQLVKMAKEAREALGVPMQHHHSEEEKKAHLEEKKNRMEIDAFTSKFKSVILATLTEDGEPFLSYAPYTKYEGESYIFISEAAEHYHNLKNNNKLDVLFIEDEEKTKSMSLRKRVRYKAVAIFVEKDDKAEKIIDKIQEFDSVVKMTRTMPDFHLVRLDLLNGRYVKGPGQAYNIEKNGHVLPVTQGASGIPHGGNFPEHGHGHKTETK